MNGWLGKKRKVLKLVQQNNGGFTMVELLVSFLVFGFVSAAVMQMMYSGAPSHAQVSDAIRLETEAQVTLGGFTKKTYNTR